MVWFFNMIDMDSRLRIAHGIAKTENLASVEVFQILKRRGHPDSPQPMVSNGWGGIDDAMVEIYGVVPECKGRGRPPTIKRPRSDWQYLQVVKNRENGRVVGIKPRVIYGDKDKVVELMGKSTVYVERTHLTMRTFNSRLTRKTLAFSKLLDMYMASAAFDDIIYNIVRLLKSLRVERFNDPIRRWIPRLLQWRLD